MYNKASLKGHLFDDSPFANANISKVLADEFQTIAAVIIELAVRSDTPTFNLNVRYFSPLFLVQLFSKHLKLSN